MSNIDLNSFTQSAEYQQELALQRTFMARVYGWMTIGLLLTALTALVVAGNTAMVKAIFGTGLFWGLIIAEFAVVFIFSAAIRALPVPVAAGLFILYSILTGATLSIILLLYTASSVAATFFITAGMFGTMSVIGYTTKKDLTSLGGFLMMGLIGLIIASIVNLFLHSPMMSWLISFVGVLVFTGLTAYDTQKIKQSYANGEMGSATFTKTALLGAFELYLDFINLFLYLLRFLGSRRD